MSTSKFDTDVLVVGSGPTGLATALSLATYGVRAHVVSMWNWLAHTPRAHITNQRTVEVFRDLGLEEQVVARATPWALMGDTLYTTSLTGEEIVRQRTWGTGDKRYGDYLQASPCTMVDIVQPKLEPILLENAAQRGSTFSFNTEYLSHEEDSDGVTVKLRKRLGGRQYSLRVRYLVGADGANSRIATQIGLPIEGHMARAGTVYTIFEANLADLVSHRPSILNWIVSSDISFGEIGMGLLRAVIPWTRWIAGWGFDVTKGDPDLTPEFITRRIKSMIGDDKVQLDLLNTSVWYVNQACSSQYSRGRVLCGGDAVHRHPPSSGLGMNTCIQDAFNLAWKLAYVIKGFAGKGLLESYTDERAPIGMQIVQRANQSRLDYGQVNACFRVEGAQNPVLAGIALLKNPGADGQTRRRALLAAIRHKDTEFNASGLESNQRYESNAILPDADSKLEEFRRDPVLYLQPTTRPGAKLPHAWLVGSNGKRISTLDTVGKGKFTVLTGLAGGEWVAAAEALDLPFIRTVVVGTPAYQDLYCDWREIMEIEEAGVILVRPDGYVAWRQFYAPADAQNARSILHGVLLGLLDNPDWSHQGPASLPTYQPNFGPHFFD